MAHPAAPTGLAAVLVVAARDHTYNARVLGALLPLVASVCLAHPTELDLEVARRARPWLPPDVARQIAHREADFKRGATAAAAWPAQHHAHGGPHGVEAIILWHCQRLSEALRNRAPFSELIAGLGALAHLSVDLNRPFASASEGGYGRGFTSYMLATRGRIPWVFYGQNRRLLSSRGDGMSALLNARFRDMAPLGSIVREDMDRVGGPSGWGRLDDRSSTFGAASLVLNHAATDYVNLTSWVWQNGGGLVPTIPLADNSIAVWREGAKPRDDTRRPVIRIRKTRR